MATMAFKIEPISDQIAKLIIQGDIDDEDGERFIEALSDFQDSLSTKKTLHYLVDARSQGKLSAHTRKLFTDQNKGEGVGKVAIFGSNRYVRVMATFTLKASGRDNIRFFESEAEALAWLQEIVEKETVS